MLVEELLAKIVGDDNVSRHIFRFLGYIQKLPRLRIHVTSVDGEPTITDVKAFYTNLKKYVNRQEIKAQKIIDGVKALEVDDVISGN